MRGFWIDSPTILMIERKIIILIIVSAWWFSGHFDGIDTMSLWGTPYGKPATLTPLDGYP
jgi:hypothetical protein